jgi:hypothetical protein
VTDSPSTHDPLLAEARSLLLRKDYTAARAGLTDLIRRDPQCTEAIQMLLSLDTAEHRRKFAGEDPGEQGLLTTGKLSRKSGREIMALLAGGLFLFGGLSSLFHFTRVGIDGAYPTRSKTGRTSMVSGREALAQGLAFSLIGGVSLIYGISRLRLR